MARFRASLCGGLRGSGWGLDEGDCSGFDCLLDLANAGTAVDVGITLEDVQGTLVAVAPIIGGPRSVAAAGNVTRALGFAIAVMEAELAAELDADSE